MKDIYIYIENGIFIKAKCFAGDGTKVGEIVFNTSMSGYQEIATDPSYAGQFVVFTMPEIGIVGANENDMESSKIHASGFLMRKYNDFVSNYRATKSFKNLINENNALGICEIDTRILTKTLRDEGAKMMIASTSISNKDELASILSKSKRIEHINLVQQVSTEKSYIHDSGTWDYENQIFQKPPKKGNKIIVIDFGVKRNILNQLCQVGFEVEVISSDFDANLLILRYQNKDFHGVFLSNGPGDPLILKKQIKEIKKLADAKIPICAICLGHQLLSIALGYDTYKLKFGQHGGNHPVINLLTNKVEITAQNHNYNVPESITKIADVTHRNLFDNTIEGLKYKNVKIYSLQHHPEASPGPTESENVFEQFYKLLS